MNNEDSAYYQMEIFRNSNNFVGRERYFETKANNVLISTTSNIYLSREMEPISRYKLIPYF